MVGFFISYLLGLLLLIGGGRQHTDLLDTISTDVYWQLKHITPDMAQLQKDAGTDAAPANIDSFVKDLGSADFATRDKARQDLERLGPAILPLLKPVTESGDAEVAAVGQELTKKFTERGQERAIRRLMAIRTLGERREKEALAQLTGLQESKDLFVPAYARRAIAEISGKTLEPEDVSAKLAGDLALLPADSALIGQTTGLGAERLTIAGLIEKVVAGAREPDLIPGQPVEKKPDAKLLTQQATQQLLTLLERIGNVQIDGVTLAFNLTKEDKPEGTEHGWVAVIIRGQYDAAAALGALKESIGEDAKITPAEKPGDITTVRANDGEAMVLLPDNQQVIFLTAPNKTDGQAIFEALVAALKTGKGTLDQNQELAALMKTVDTKSPVWTVGKFTDYMSKELMDGAFKSITLESKVVKEGTAFTIKVQTVDADRAKGVVEKVAAEIKSELEDLKKEVAVMPAMKPVAELLGSIKVSSEGASATMTGQLPGGMLTALLGQLPVVEMLMPREVVPMALPETQPVEELPLIPEPMGPQR